MVKWQTVRHQVALCGRVVDADTRKPIEGARVSIEDGPDGFTRLLEIRAIPFLRGGGLPQIRDPKTKRYIWPVQAERPGQTRTATDGIFYFLDLPEGEYALSASLESMGVRYGAAQAKAKVSRTDDDGDPGYRRAFVELHLQATTVRGRIVDSASKNGVVMAEVRMKGSGERTFSDTEGQYVLAGIEPSKRHRVEKSSGRRGDGIAERDQTTRRTILVFAQSYTPASEQVEIEGPGAVVEKDIKLVR